MSQRELQDESDVFLWREDLEQIPQDEEDNEVIPGRGPISSPYLPESFDEMLQEAVDLTQTDADFSMPTENLSGLDSLSTNTLNGSLEPRLELQLIDLGPIIPEIIQMENERKKQIDDELERAACGHSLSDKLTGPGDSSGSDGDSKKQRRPQKRSLPRPPTLTFGDRCITPQRTNRTSLSPQAPLTPNSPRSPRSFRSHQTHRTEIHHHTFETTNRAPPSPVPPFVVVYTSGSAHVTVRPTSRALQNPSTVDEEIINSNLSLWRRGCLFFWTALLFLATVTMIAGLVRTQKLRQGSGSDDPKFKIPSIQNQTFLPTTSLNPAQTQSPGFIISNEDNDGGSIIPPLNIQTGDDDEQVLSGFRDETSSPAGAPPTWPPRTRAPVPGPSSSPSTVLADDGDYDEDIDEVSSGFRDETPCPEGASPTGPPRTRAPVSAPTSPTQDYVKDVITNMLNTSFAELSNPNPPRSRALEWIALDPLVEDRTYSDSRIFQRWVLATFFYSTGGDSWYDSNGWVSYTDDCTWFSTRNGHRICDAKGNLEVLDLEHNNLSGSIPHELGILSNSLSKLETISQLFLHDTISYKLTFSFPPRRENILARQCP